MNSWKNGFVINEIQSLLVGRVLWERARVQSEMFVRCLRITDYTSLEFRRSGLKIQLKAENTIRWDLKSKD